MARVDFKVIRQKLNNVCTKALEATVGSVMTRTHYEITIDHLLATLMERPESDFVAILNHFEVSVPKLHTAINRALEDQKTGNSGRPQINPYLLTLLEDALLIATAEFGAGNIRSGAITLALIRTPDVAVLSDFTDELKKIKEDVLKKDFFAITADSRETERDFEGKAPGAATGSTEALDQFTTDLTEKARGGGVASPPSGSASRATTAWSPTNTSRRRSGSCTSCGARA